MPHARTECPELRPPRKIETTIGYQRRFTQSATLNSLREAWRRDEVYGAERIATPNERAVCDRIGKRALTEPVATPPRWIGEVGLRLREAARGAVERTDGDHRPGVKEGTWPDSEDQDVVRNHFTLLLAAALRIRRRVIGEHAGQDDRGKDGKSLHDRSSTGWMQKSHYCCRNSEPVRAPQTGRQGIPAHP